MAKIPQQIPVKPQKKCVPGFFCIENMTLFFLIIFILFVIYFIFQILDLGKQIRNLRPTNGYNYASVREREREMNTEEPSFLRGLISPLVSRSTMDDPYYPPLQIASGALPVYPNRQIYSGGGIKPGIPINIETRGLNTGFTQIGLLTSAAKPDLILPLMGRRTQSGRDNWQYYSISNTGSLNTKLPIKIKNKNCSSEYGCDSLYDGDSVFVEGYKETFKTTIYENGLFSYLPY
jgi:hypothetical protein